MDASSIIKQYNSLEGGRGVWDSHYQEIAERIWPEQAIFRTTVTPGAKRTEKIFDATACLALQRFLAAIDSLVTPQGTKWHGLCATSPELDRVPAVRKYFEQVTDILFKFRYSTKANFAHQAHQVYGCLGAFGTGAMIVEPRDSGGIMYKSLPLANTYIKQNSEDLVDVLFRKFKWTARQAKQKWGDNIPDCIGKCDNYDKEFNFIQAIMPRDDYDPMRIDYMGKPIASVYICLEDPEMIIEEGGYYSFPAMVCRYMTSPGETYGRSPAMTVLPDIKMLNEMSKTTIRVAQKRADPPLLIFDDIAANPVSMKPSALNVGGVNADGKQMIVPMQTGGDPGLSLEMMDQKRKIINDAFLVTLFQILVEGNNRMTATEVIERAREKGALLAPTASRITHEFTGPLIEREIDILSRQGFLPEMPGELLEAKGEYRVQYDSPLARAQRSEEAVGYSRTMEQIIPLAQIDNSILKIFKGVEIGRGLAQINGMPSRWLKDDNELAAEQAQEAQAAQAQQLLEAAPVISQSQKNLAQAQQIAMSGASGRV